MNSAEEAAFGNLFQSGSTVGLDDVYVGDVGLEVESSVFGVSRDNLLSLLLGQNIEDDGDTASRNQFSSDTAAQGTTSTRNDESCLVKRIAG